MRASIGLLSIVFTFLTFNGFTQIADKLDINKSVKDIESKVIEYRRHFHQYPELSNREFNTSDKIVSVLKDIGLKPKQGMAHTGVVAVLDSGRPGPTIGLRADIDGLPVSERNDLPYKSEEESEFLGKKVGVMHACGHDTHIAMLLGAAEILYNHKDELSGKIVFVFQPAEEGPPPGEEGGAMLMVKEGLIKDYGIDVMFGQHIRSILNTGELEYRLGGLLAAADRFEIKVKGKQAHGSRPWSGVDPIVTAAQIVIGLQTIISRQTELTKDAAVITIGKIEGGVRNNIIPEECTMVGTIRTLDEDMQKIIHEKIKLTAESIAISQGATADVIIEKNCPVTYNNLELTRQMLPSLYKAAGEDNVHVRSAITGAEDFAYYAEVIPSFFYFVGGMSHENENPGSHHSPDFSIDEAGMATGVKAFLHLTLDYMAMNQE